MNTSLELLRRIDEKDFLTEREHRQFLDELKKRLEVFEMLMNHCSVQTDYYDCDDMCSSFEFIEFKGDNDTAYLPLNEDELNKVKELI